MMHEDSQFLMRYYAEKIVSRSRKVQNGFKPSNGFKPDSNPTTVIKSSNLRIPIDDSSSLKDASIDELVSEMSRRISAKSSIQSSLNVTHQSNACNLVTCDASMGEIPCYELME